MLLPFGVIASVYFNNWFFLVAIIANGLAIFLEKIYQKNNKFLFGILFKPLIAIFNITFLLFNFRIIKSDVDSINILCLAFFFAILVYGYPCLRKMEFSKINAKEIFPGIVHLVNRGFWLNLGTASISLLLFTDRIYLKVFDIIALSEYSLAFSLSQMLFIFFTSTSYINEVKLGEKFKDLSVATFMQSIYNLGKFYIIGLISISVIFFVVIYFLPAYRNSYIYFFALVPFWGFFFAAGTLGMLAQYFGFQRRMTILILVISLLNFLLYLIFERFRIHLPPLFWVLKTSILITAFSTYQLFEIRKSILQ